MASYYHDCMVHQVVHNLHVYPSIIESLWYTLGTCSAKLCDKTIQCSGFVLHIYFGFLTPLKICVPHLEILFSINHYFLVFISKYCSSWLIFSLKFYFILGQISSGTVFFHPIIGCNSKSTKTRTLATTTAESGLVLSPDCVFTMIVSSILMLCFSLISFWLIVVWL